MAYSKTLVSPRGRKFIAHDPAEANDLLAQGYTEDTTTPVRPQRTSRAPRVEPPATPSESASTPDESKS